MPAYAWSCVPVGDGLLQGIAILLLSEREPSQLQARVSKQRCLLLPCPTPLREIPKRYPCPSALLQGSFPGEMDVFPQLHPKLFLLCFNYSRNHCRNLSVCLGSGTRLLILLCSPKGVWQQRCSLFLCSALLRKFLISSHVRSSPKIHSRDLLARNGCLCQSGKGNCQLNKHMPYIGLLGMDIFQE